MAASVCSRFHQAIELIGKKWNGAILFATLRGAYRFCDIRKSVPAMSDTMLTHRLRELEAAGLLRRDVIPSSPVRVEYHPTEMCQELLPVLNSLGSWANKWIAGSQGQGIEE